MLHNYVPSGSGRDAFIFNDTEFQHGRHGVYKVLDRAGSRDKHSNEFWESCEKKTKRKPKTLPLKFLHFPTERPAPPEDPKEAEEPAPAQDAEVKKKRPISERPPAPRRIAGYAGHVAKAHDAVGRPAHLHEHEVASLKRRDFGAPENALSLPSFGKMDTDRLQRRLNTISKESASARSGMGLMQELRSKMPQPHQKRVETGIDEVKYVVGYSGHVPESHRL